MNKEQIENECEKAMRLIFRGECKKGVNALTALAEQGYPEAQCELGGIHCKGQGVDRDYEQALKWYGGAAEQGYAEAQYQLGWMYKGGLGVEKNTTKALEYFQLAANQGHFFAKHAVLSLSPENLKPDEVQKRFVEEIKKSYYRC